MNVKIEESWKNALSEEFEKEYFLNLTNFIKKEYKEQVVYPPAKDIFRAFNLCPIEKTKVVIIGQDPYHGPNQANGLCFSVSEGIQIPPSLLNIYKELESDTGLKINKNGDLTKWAEQGVLLLNATLTVRKSQPTSHNGKGWEDFTDSVIRELNTKKQNIVYLLWGSYAQKKGLIIDRKNNLVLESAHPSPLSASRGFLGNKHFTKTNAYLIMNGLDPISW